MSEHLPRLTIITPVFNEQDSLDRYVEEVEQTLINARHIECHVLFVDDGSHDKSWEKIEGISRRNPRFTGLRLSRNFGSHAAITAGIDHADARTDAIAILACDLQDPPSTVLAFIDCWLKGAEIVWGTRRSRPESFIRRQFALFFNILLRRYAAPPRSKFATGSFLLLDKKVAEAFKQFKEHHRTTFALVAWTGFEQDIVLYDRQPRRAGQSGWTVAGMTRAVYDTMIGYSVLPARLMTWIGVATGLFGIGFMIWLILQYYMMDVVTGWTGIMVTMAFFFSLLFLMLGLMAQILYRIFVEATGRPIYFVARRTDAKNNISNVL